MKKTKVKMNKPVYLGISILGISKILIFEFWYDYIKAKYKTKQNYAKLISTVLLLISKLKIFKKIQLMMFKNSLTHQTTVKMTADHFQQVRNRK